MRIVQHNNALQDGVYCLIQDLLKLLSQCRRYGENYRQSGLKVTLIVVVLTL